MFHPPPQALEAAIGGRENNDLCFRSEYAFQVIAGICCNLVKLDNNVPKIPQENNDLCFRSEYAFQVIAEICRNLVNLVNNVPDIPP